ncbi:MAG: hypothetical protein CVU44_07125 [Chloroflexi bacterium HGW-Chloroflexi-6]|nr:MAG: hypothetical protein CVU44_07125 [Chloroflexi bacterium HGW-Chloroflexi-6]
MKRRILLGAAVLVFALTAFYAGNAYAATGCFPDTNGHWAETFICWMKEKGITGGFGDGTYRPNNTVSRAEMAVFLNKLFVLLDTKIDQTAVTLDTKIDQTATTLDTKIDQTLTGDILISAGFANWHPFNSTDPLSYTYFSSQTQVSRSAVGSSFLSVNPDIPPVLYGKSLLFKGVVFCYDTFASTSLNYVEINTYSHTTGSLGRNLRFSDPTTRTGNACRTYTLSSPVVLGPNDGVNFFIQVNWSAASTQFAIGRTTFIFAATTTPAAPSLAPASAGSGSDVTLQPMPETDTSAP